jgi:hypothetical protein
LSPSPARARHSSPPRRLTASAGQIEIDAVYCDAIIRRWQEMTGGEAILEETGETFATVKGQRLREGEV